MLKIVLYKIYKINLDSVMKILAKCITHQRTSETVRK